MSHKEISNMNFDVRELVSGAILHNGQFAYVRDLPRPFKDKDGNRFRYVAFLHREGMPEKPLFMSNNKDVILGGFKLHCKQYSNGTLQE